MSLADNTAPAAIPEEEEVPTPGLVDTFKDQGILGGLKTLSPYLIPGVATGEQFAQKATDGISVSDVFSSLGDFGEEVAYGTPLTGDLLSIRDYMQMPDDADWLTKGLNTLGLVGAGTTGAGVSTAGVLALLPARVPVMSRKTADIPIIPVDYSSPDALSAMSLDMTEPLTAEGLIATTKRTQKQIMIAVSQSKLTSSKFDSAQAFSRIRQAITGTERKNGRFIDGNGANAGQVDTFLSGLGELLIDNVRDYNKSSGELSPDQVRVQAVANETAKFDWLANESKDGLNVSDELGDVTRSWNRLKAGELLSEAEQVELGAAIVKMADWTQGNLHPEFALNDPRIAITGMNLSSGGGELMFSMVDMDGVPRQQLTQDDVIARISLMASLNTGQIAVEMVMNLESAWKALVVPNLDKLQKSVQRSTKTHQAMRVDENVRMVWTDELKTFRSKEPAELGDLKESLRTEGINEPLIVEYNPTNGAAKLVDGHKRLDAAVDNGLEAVPVLVNVNRKLKKEGSGDLGAKSLRQLLGNRPGRTPDSVRAGDAGFSAVPAVYQGIIPEPLRDYGSSHNWYQIAYGDIKEQANLYGLNPQRLVGVASYLSAGEQWETNIEKAVVAALYAKDNPKFTGADLQAFVTSAGHKISEDEAKAVRALYHVGDDDLSEFFGEDLTRPEILKQANFVEGIIRSSDADIDLQAKAAYGMYTGLIDDIDLPRLERRVFGETDRLTPLVVDRHAHSMTLGFSMEPTGTIDNKLYRTAKRAFEQFSVALGPQRMPDGTVRLYSPGEIQAIMWVAWREARGVTKDYKYYDPSKRDPNASVGNTSVLINSPDLWEPGVGPKFVMRDRLLRLAYEPLPEHLAFRNLPPSEQGVPMTADDAVGRFISTGQSKRRSNQGVATSPQRAVMKVGPDGSHVEIPEGIQTSGTARGTYPSLAGSELGQQMLHQKPMATNSIEGVQRTIARNTMNGPPIMRRKIDRGHQAWAFQPGRTMVISASSPENHRRLANELTESGIKHKHKEEQPYEMVGAEENTKRYDMVLQFEDAHELARAWKILENGSPLGQKEKPWQAPPDDFDGRFVDYIYNEKPDLVAYVNGDIEAPEGALKAFENHYVDDTGMRLEHLSTDGDMSQANSTPVWVSKSGSWETVGSQDTGVGSHRFEYDDATGVLTWDGVAQIINPEVIGDADKLAALASREVKSLFATGEDLKIRGKSVKEVTVMVPPEGTGPVQMFFGEVGDQALPVGWDPARTVRISRPTPHKLTAHMPQFGDVDQFNSALATDLVQFMNRTRMWRFGHKEEKTKAGRKLYLPEFKVGD